MALRERFSGQDGLAGGGFKASLTNELTPWSDVGPQGALTLARSWSIASFKKAPSFALGLGKELKEGLVVVVPCGH
jgi:hypothetical protein